MSSSLDFSGTIGLNTSVNTGKGGENGNTLTYQNTLINASDKNYGARQHISRIMRSLGLVSKYTQLSYKAHSTECNESTLKNRLVPFFLVHRKHIFHG